MISFVYEDMYRKIVENDELSFVKKYLTNIASLPTFSIYCAKLINNTYYVTAKSSTGLKLILYFSPEIHDYRIVSLRRLYGMDFFSKNIIDPILLDKFLNIFGSSNDVYILSIDEYSNTFYKTFGSVMIDLVITPYIYDDGIIFETNIINSNSSYNVNYIDNKYDYYTGSNSIKLYSINNIIDSPINILQTDNITDTTTYTYGTYYSVSDYASNDYFMTLNINTANIFNNLSNIYSYINNISNFNIITINNEWSFPIKYTTFNNNSWYLTPINEHVVNSIISNQNIRVGAIEYLDDSIFTTTFKNLVNSIYTMFTTTNILNVGTTNQLNYTNTKHILSLYSVYDDNIKNDIIQNSTNLLTDIIVPMMTTNTMGYSFIRVNDDIVCSYTNNYIISEKLITKNLSLYDKLVVCNIILAYTYLLIYPGYNQLYSPVSQIYTSTIHNVSISNTISPIYKNYIGGLTNRSIYRILPTSIEFNDSNITQWRDLKYTLDFKIIIDNDLVTNIYLTPDRFKIYGCAIDINLSDSNALADVVTLQTLQDAIKYNKIVINKYPLPIIIGNVRNSGNLNLVPNSLINVINENFDIDNYITNTSLSVNGLDIYNEKSSVLSYITDNTNINSFDKSLFIQLNTGFLQYNFTELRAYNNLSAIYILHDTYTNTNTIFEVKCNRQDISYHNWRNILIYPSTNRKYQYFQVIENQQFAIDTITETFSIYKDCSYIDNIDHIYFKTLNCYNYTNINGSIDSITVIGDVLNIDTLAWSRMSVTVDSTDYTITNSIASVNIDNILPQNCHMIKNVQVSVIYRKLYKQYSYKDVFSIVLVTNVSDLQTKVDFSYNATFIGDEHNLNIVYINTVPTKLDNILPQLVYNKNISLSLFDIDEDIWDLVPDNKMCIIFNNFFNNTLDNITLTDITGVDTTQTCVVDRFEIDYKKSESYLKLEPILIDNNLNKYCKILVRVIHHELSDMFETFEYINTYNNTLTDNIKGTLIAEGRISDYTTGDSFEECFRLYKTQLLLTVLHNVNNNISVPVDIYVTCELFNTFNDYITNSDATTYDILNDQILIDIKNRGEYIEETSDYYPKFTDIIEYYEIYPEYSWQVKKDYIYTLEMKLISTDVAYVKVSELFFDILFGTEDLWFGIPKDYTSNEDPEQEVIDTILLNSNYIENREYILDYVNWLVRHKCPNCGSMVYKFKVKLKPTMYGFNVAAFMLGCYSHNVKLELRLQNIFYKESADTTFILDEKQQFIEYKEEIPIEQKESFLNSLTNKDKIILTDIGYVNPQSIDIKSATVGKSINRMILFNSSKTMKIINFDLFKNDTSKDIHTTHVSYTLAPMEIKIATITEQIQVIDYNSTYDSGILLYSMNEIDIISDQTTFIQYINLAIPSVDSYITNMLSLINKTTEYVEVDYDINRFPVFGGDISNIGSNKMRTSLVKITKNEYTEPKIHITTGVQDLVYNFFINESYIVEIPHDNIGEIYNNMKVFGKNIFIKIPFKIDDRSGSVEANSNFAGHIPEVDNIGYVINNFINADQGYYYLIGNRIDINKFEFTVKYLLHIDNITLYTNFLNTNTTTHLATLDYLELKLSIDPINIPTLLAIIFNKNDIIEYNYIVDNFINNNISHDDIDAKIISGGKYIVLSGKSENIKKTTPQFETLNFTLNPTHAFHNVSNEYYRLNDNDDIYNYVTSSDGELVPMVTSVMGVSVSTLTEKVNESDKIKILQDIHEHRHFPRGGVKMGQFLGCVGCKSETLCIIKTCCDSKKGIPHGSNGISTNNNFSTNNAYEYVFSEQDDNENDRNVFLNLFKGSGVYELIFPIGITAGVPRKHYIRTEIDGKFDQIISTKIATGGKIYPINYTGDDDIFITSNAAIDDNLVNSGDNISINNDNTSINDASYLILQVSNMKWQTLSVITKDIFQNEIITAQTNENYALYKETMEQLLASPLQITLPNDMATKPIIITTDTNYKMIFEIPFRVNKVLEAYLVIDKVKVIDDFLHETDYCFMFNDTNERHFVKSNTSKLLNKTFYKYDNELRFLCRMFNVPNQSGEHYSNIMVYYTFNGDAKVFTHTFRYRIVLPNVLDNEYLLVKQERLDKPEIMFDQETANTLVPLETTLQNDIWTTSTTLGACGCGCNEYNFNWKTKTVKSTDTYYS